MAMETNPSKYTAVPSAAVTPAHLPVGGCYNAPETGSDRQGRYALLTPDACVDRDPKAQWRLSLANRTNLDGIKLTDADCAAWLDANDGHTIRLSEAA